MAARAGGQDWFSLLATGATFDMKRFRKQVDVFKGNQGGSGVENGSESAGEKNLQRKSGKKRPLNAESGDVHRCKQQCRKDRLQEMLPGFDISRMSKEEALCKFRKSKQMKVSGSDVPQPIYGFEDLQDCIGASPLLAKTLLSQGFKEPSSIQMQAIPALAKWRDVVGIAPTGSGKTLAFLVPIVTLLEQECAKKHEEGIKALILCPTKELAMQTTRVIRSVLAGMHSILQLALLGPTDLESIQQADIVLATPLKLTSLVEKQKLDLAHVRFLVLDEADRLFEREKIKSKKKSMENQPPKHEASDSVPLVNNAEETLDADSSEALSRRHFLNQIDTIISSCVHPELVRALFSATFPSHVEVLARNILQDPITITIGRLNSAVDSVKQHLVFVGSEKGKLLGLKQLLKSGLKPPILVFVDTKERVKVLRKELMQGGVKVDCIHSDQNPQARQAALDNFRIGHVWVLVSTDVLGRGIDFLGVKVVVNYDFPRSSMDYIHRIGRTGRAGRSGEAYTLYTEDDACHLRPIANLVKESGSDVPEWMLSLKREKWSSKVSYGKVDSLPRVDPATKARKTRKVRRNREKNSRKKSGNVPSEQAVD